MDYLTGLLSINGQDAWTTYKAFLAETGMDGHNNMDELLAVPQSKEQTVVDFPERDGEELPDDIEVRLQAVNRVLRFAVFGDTESERMTNYRNLMKELTAGMVSMVVKDLRTYNMYYRQMDPPEWYNCYSGRHVVIFDVTMREPKPVI